jgi:hypothetical protein
MEVDKVAKTLDFYVRFHVVTVATLKVTTFRGIVPCNLVEVDRRFVSAYCLHYQDYELFSAHLLKVVLVQRDYSALYPMFVGVFLWIGCAGRPRTFYHYSLYGLEKLAGICSVCLSLFALREFVISSVQTPRNCRERDVWRKSLARNTSYSEVAYYLASWLLFKRSICKSKLGVSSSLLIEFATAKEQHVTFFSILSYWLICILWR